MRILQNNIGTIFWSVLKANMDRKTKINYLYSTFYQVLAVVLPLVTTPYVSRVLNVETIGVYSFTGSIVSYFTLLASFSFQTYGQREIAYVRNDKKKISQLFFEIQLKKFILMIISYALFGIFLLKSREYEIMYLLQSLSIIAAFFDITYLLQGLEQFRLTVIRNTLVKLVGVVLTFALVKEPSDVYIYTIIQTGVTLLGNISMWVYLPKFVSIKHVNMGQLSHGIVELIQLFIPVLSVQLYYTIDKTMLGMVTNGMTENGYYEQAIKIIRLCQNMMGAMGAVLLSSIPRLLITSGKQEVKKTIDSSIGLNLFVAVPITAGLISIADIMVPWFFGSGYEKTAELICIFAPMAILSAISMVFGNGVLIPLKKQNCLTLATLGAACFNIVFNMLLIPQFGAIGAAVSSVGAEVVTLLIQGAFSKEYIKFISIIKNFMKYSIAATVMSVFLYFIKKFAEGRIKDFILTIMLVVVGAVIYFWVLVFQRENIATEIKNKIYNKFKYR